MAGARAEGPLTPEPGTCAARETGQAELADTMVTVLARALVNLESMFSAAATLVFLALVLLGTKICRRRSLALPEAG